MPRSHAPPSACTVDPECAESVSGVLQQSHRGTFLFVLTGGLGFLFAVNRPVWIPLPPRALDRAGAAVEHLGAAPLGAYEFRFEFVCLECGNLQHRHFLTS